jgi:hypothetical protein
MREKKNLNMFSWNLKKIEMKLEKLISDRIQEHGARECLDLLMRRIR